MRRAKKVPKVRIEVRKLPVVEHDELCLTFDASTDQRKGR